MERLTTEFVLAGIDRQQQNPAISEREGATVPLAPGTRDQVIHSDEKSLALIGNATAHER
jgi:hypothetical protein